MLEAKGLRKSYRGRQALPPVSFTLPEGCCLGLTGDNGAGKSTLLRLLAQVEPPDGGDICYRGRSVLGDRRFSRLHVGYVPQDAGLLPGLTAKRQLKLWQSACGLSGPLPGWVLELLDLGPLLPVLTEELSGGQQRRVSIGMALLSAPEILLMDEAGAGLAEEYRSRLLDWTERFLAAGGRAVWCSHREEELARLCGSRLTLKSV